MRPKDQTIQYSTIEPMTHRTLDFAELESLGLLPEAVLDFSVNSNPFGPSPLVLEALAKVVLDRYPDRESRLLRRTLAERFAIAPEQILVGNGSAELIHLAAQTFLDPGDSALVLGSAPGRMSVSGPPAPGMASPCVNIPKLVPEESGKNQMGWTANW